MQITPNSDTGTTQESNSTPLGEGQDQLVLVLDLRREDPVNPDGSPALDLGPLLSGQDTEKAEALSFLLDSIADVLGFDTSLSLFSISKVVDFEPGTPGPISFDDLRGVVHPPAEEVPTEQPIEPVNSTPEDTGAVVVVDSAGVATVLDGGDAAPTETPVVPTEDPVVPTDEPSAPVPSAIEDIPHVQAPDPAPVGDSVATDPGPVDPPVEG